MPVTNSCIATGLAVTWVTVGLRAGRGVGGVGGSRGLGSGAERRVLRIPGGAEARRRRHRRVLGRRAVVVFAGDELHRVLTPAVVGGLVLAVAGEVDPVLLATS